MLKEIKINNLAIVDELQIKLCSTFNVITGRSGSGKTIIYKAINYLFGEKFNKNDIRKDEEKCEVSGILFIDSKDYIIRRVFTQSRTENYIDDQRTNIKDYVNFISRAWESYGQHEQQKLLNEQNHLAYLDLFACNEIHLKEYNQLYTQYIDIKKEIDEIVDTYNEYNKNKELYVFQFEELDGFELEINEDLDIKVAIESINKTKKIHDSLRTLSNLGSGVNDKVKSFIDDSEGMNNKDVNDLNKRLDVLLEEISDIEYQSVLMGNNFYYDFNELERLEKRLQKINELKRKYGGSIESVIKHKKHLNDLINGSTGIEEKITDMNNEREMYKFKLSKLAKNIHKDRTKAARSLESSVVSDLCSMNMKSVEFTVELGSFTINDRAIDNCEFHIRTNKGESIKSISQIVSGGELSRVMMSIKLSINSKSSGKIFLLDEIDSGLSGVEADSLGNVIKDLSRKNQIICITHLSQIAAKAKSHIKTSKSIIDNRTICHANVLEKENLVDELAAMISGKNITKGSLEYARGISKE